MKKIDFNYTCIYLEKNIKYKYLENKNNNLRLIIRPGHAWDLFIRVYIGPSGARLGFFFFFGYPYDHETKSMVIIRHCITLYL